MKHQQMNLLGPLATGIGCINHCDALLGGCQGGGPEMIRGCTTAGTQQRLSGTYLRELRMNSL